MFNAKQHTLFSRRLRNEPPRQQHCIRYIHSRREPSPTFWHGIEKIRKIQYMVLTRKKMIITTTKNSPEMHNCQEVWGAFSAISGVSGEIAPLNK